MNEVLKKTLTLSSALLMVLSAGAGINNINVNAKRRRPRRVKIVKRHKINHRYNRNKKKQRKARRHSGRKLKISSSAEYKAGEKQGKNNVYVQVPTTSTTGYYLGEPFSKYISIGKKLNNKSFRSGFYKGQSTQDSDLVTNQTNKKIINALRNLANHSNKQYRKGWIDNANSSYYDYIELLKDEDPHSPLIKGKPASHNLNYMKGWNYAKKELNGVFSE